MFLKFLNLGVQIESDMDGMTLLMEAAFEGHLEMVKYLVNHTQDLRLHLNQRDKANRNAMFYAFENSQLAVVDFMLSHGATLETADHRKSALMCACLKSNIHIVNYCLKNMEVLKLKLSDTDDKGRNVLFYAVTGGCTEILKLLIEAGAQVQTSPDGINLLMQAAGKRQLDVGRYVHMQTERGEGEGKRE